MRKILKTCLIVPVCLVSLAQCGLEYLPFLTPPSSLTKTPTAFRVQKTKYNDTEKVDDVWEYQGIELYYKFYKPDTVVPSLEKNLTRLSELASYGFHRISRYKPPGDDAQTDKDKAIRKPVLEIDTDTWTGDVDFIIDMAGLDMKNQPPPPAPPPDPTIFVEQIRRGVPYDPVAEQDKYPYFQQFIDDDFDAADDDVGSDLYNYITGNPGSNIIMVLYALSYGKTDGLLVDLYSDAVYLGDIGVNFGW